MADPKKKVVRVPVPQKPETPKAGLVVQKPQRKVSDGDQAQITRPPTRKASDAEDTAPKESYRKTSNVNE